MSFEDITTEYIYVPIRERLTYKLSESLFTFCSTQINYGENLVFITENIERVDHWNIHGRKLDFSSFSTKLKTKISRYFGIENIENFHYFQRKRITYVGIIQKFASIRPVIIK